MQDFKLRCRRCREVVIVGDRVVNTHGEKLDLLQGDPCSNQATDSVWYVTMDIEQLPWIQAAVSEASWLKGKLTCPKCKGRIGSFDLTNSSQCPCRETTLSGVHILRDRVDRVSIKPIAVALPTAMERFHGNASAVLPEASALSRKNSSDANGTELAVAVDSEGTVVERLVMMSQATSSTMVQCNSRKNRLRVRRRGSGTAGVDQGRLPLLEADREGSQCTDQEHTSEREVGQHGEGIPDEHVCPVCLDVYLNPHRCHPCRHVFCECCLRQLCERSDNSSSFPCPMCRELINHCSPEHDLTCTIKKCYPKSYQYRRQSDYKYLSHRYPLPKSTLVARPRVPRAIAARAVTVAADVVPRGRPHPGRLSSQLGLKQSH